MFVLGVEHLVNHKGSPQDGRDKEEDDDDEKKKEREERKNKDKPNRIKTKQQLKQKKDGSQFNGQPSSQSKSGAFSDIFKQP